jgi:nucleotidyltransferase/DNA polymerase involved in DNA repair
MSRRIMHINLDAFFVSAEQLKRERPSRTDAD